MISDIKEIFSMLQDLYKSNIENNNIKFNNCIADIFERTRR